MSVRSGKSVWSVLALLGLGCGDGVVDPPASTVATVAVTPATVTLAVTQAAALTAHPRDASGAPVGGRTITWTSLNPDIATVSSAGLVTAASPGTTTISAATEGKSGTATVTVTPGPVAIVTISPSTANLIVGQTAQLLHSVRDALGNVIPGRAATWASSAPVVASVSSAGVVTAHAAGGATITATVDGVVGQATVLVTAPPVSNLEIHQINVGWGSAVLIRGPDGTTVLLEAGDTGEGTRSVVPYLKSIGIQPATGLDYTIAGHQHCDHVGGLDEVIQAGYGVRRTNYYNGSATSSSCTSQWQTAAATTAAGAPTVPALGSSIALGGGATLTIVAVNGRVLGGGQVAVSDENDRSIAVLLKFGGFDYLWGSDLGGGDADNACTGRSTSQRDVETSLITAISPGGAAPMISAGGIDVLYVNHHGSESSTNSTYMNRTRPAVAIVPVGAGQSSTFQLPRRAVVERVLLAQAACVTVPASLVLQTEEGSPAGAETSFAGFNAGDIKVVTDGQTGFTVTASGRVTQGLIELAAAGLPRTFFLDDLGSTAPAATLLATARGGHR